ncbi:hypothetical protein [Streptomyces sp. NPDC005731]
MPNSGQRSNRRRLERNLGENLFWTDARRPLRISFASSIWSTVAV